MDRKTICVFCSATDRLAPLVVSGCLEVIGAMAARGYAFVYGGAQVGLMGQVADEALQKGAQVTGVIPQSLMKKEIAHENLTELLVVKDLYERKQKMIALSSHFLILPGGLGTLDEALEVVTQKQLGLLDAPIAFFDHLNFWQTQLAFFSELVALGLVGCELEALAQRCIDLAGLVEYFEAGEACTT